MNPNNIDIDSFLKGQLPVAKAQQIRQQMLSDPDFARQVKQRKLELLVVEELEQQHWKKTLTELEQEHQKADQLEQLVIDKLNKDHWKSQLQDLENDYKKTTHLEDLVKEELSNQHWRKQLKELEKEHQKTDKLEELVKEELETQHWKKQLQELEQDHQKTRKLEGLVVEELEQQHWKKRLNKLEQQHQKSKCGRVIRMISIASATAAAIAALWIVVIPLFLNDPTTVGGLTGNDFNLKNHKVLLAEKDFDAALLAGEWITTIEELKNTGLQIEMTINPANDFTIVASFFGKNETQLGDKTTARGTWSVKEDNLLLELDKGSIKKQSKTSNPFEANAVGGVIEKWLKEKRLFTKPLKIVDVSNDYMILRYNRREGIEWKKQN